MNITLDNSKFYIIAILVGFILATALVGRLIPFLKKHQLKQYEREEGPDSHKGKTGTPSMGGIGIIIACVLACFITMAFAGWDNIVVCGLIMLVLHGLLGFKDDYLKATEHKNDGISAKQKIIFQVLLSIAVMVCVKLFTPNPEFATSIWIPFTTIYFDLGYFYYGWVLFVMVAFTNAVNLTDGLDGLASSVTTVVGIAMGIICMQTYPGTTGIIYFALAGCCLGFLVYNHYPAKIFMGDTGSMAMGGMMAAVAIILKLEIILAIVGLIYVIEALSVVLQVASYKLTKKRIFRMAPIHHHFELGGWSEKKVVTMFTIGTLVIAVLTVMAICIL